MTFNCQIKLCFKHEDCSDIMPPKCGINEKNTKIAGNSLDEDLETEQLFTTSPSATSPSTPPSPPTTIHHLSRSKATVSMSPDFPRPNVLPIIDVEGSGESESDEIIITTTSSPSPTSTDASSTTTTTTTQTIQILKKGGNKSAAAASASAKVVNRLQRHSPPKPTSLVNFDIQSPELTIMDDYLDPN
uniref:Uncharacterized protein n=1 Tax=Panagrolaimus superbus TaxID=310955 RepID=A0A914XPU2_9BILA